MNHQFQTGKINTTRRHVGRHANAGTSVTHGLQGMGSFVLRQFTRQSHNAEPTVGKTGRQARNHGAGVAKHDGIARIVKPQHVDDRVFGVARGNGHGLVFDIGVLTTVANRGDAYGITLEVLGQLGDGRRYGRGKHQGAAALGGLAKNILKILAESQIKHLVRFVQHNCAQRSHVDRATLDMIHQTARCGDNNMCPTRQGATFFAHIHTADAGRDNRARRPIEPNEFAFHLKRQFARWRDDQGQRCARCTKCVILAQKGRRNGKAKANGLTRAGLRRDKQISLAQLGRGDGLLDRGQGVVALGLKGGGNSLFHGQLLCHAGLKACQ